MASWFGLLQGSHRFFREGFARNNQLGGVKIMEVSWNMESLWFLLVVVIAGRRCHCSMAQFLCHWTGLQSIHSWLSFSYIWIFFKKQLYIIGMIGILRDPVATNQYHELVIYKVQLIIQVLLVASSQWGSDVLEVSFPETNSKGPWKLMVERWYFLLGNAYFSGAFPVSFRECTGVAILPSYIGIISFQRFKESRLSTKITPQKVTVGRIAGWFCLSKEV